jgi:hypothetical protein
VIDVLSRMLKKATTTNLIKGLGGDLIEGVYLVYNMQMVLYFSLKRRNHMLGTLNGF